VSTPKAPSSEHSPSASASLAPDSMRSKLAAASKDDLVRLIERLAADSAEVSARLDYLTDPDAAAKALQGRIRSIRSNKRFVSGRPRRWCDVMRTSPRSIWRSTPPTRKVTAQIRHNRRTSAAQLDCKS
jgi:hypothetical protein